MIRKGRTFLLFFLLIIINGILAGGVKSDAAAKPSLISETACVMDINSGTILYDKDMKKKEYPASITKILTTLVALENSSLDEKVKYTKDAFANWESGASNIEIVAGEKISMEESLYAVMLASANEACNGVAHYICGDIDKFVEKMNAKAQSLGCANSHFANTNGLWRKDHYTCAYDMALIGREAMKNPTFRTITGTKIYRMSKTNKRKAGYTLINHHKMLCPANYPQLEYKYCTGGKTGYTYKCKNTLVTFAKKDDLELVCVVMRNPGAAWQPENAYTDSTKLLNYCFQNYEGISIENDKVNEINSKYLFTKFAPMYNSEEKLVHLEKGAQVVLPKGAKLSETTRNIEFFDQPTDNVGKKIIGKVTYQYDGSDVGSSNIYFESEKATTLNDSINMSEWFDEAKQEAEKEPFPWRKAIVITIAIVIVMGLIIFALIMLRSYKIRTENRRRYRNRRRGNSRRDRDFYIR
ncbi:D-alanyl-D-alanine carboxypeptidase family protein [Eubacterium xylanophilum]|uniref:D-alanyl-D-alanine carboxypeptidase family protein n=1 Tax=Eubacterium xylanophilum TaxID=39497 RepID=UPI0004B0FA19|nr:D-alanyl-D-alanine carboxypeptidase family protein [Eubacterium xylanophilum]